MISDDQLQIFLSATRKMRDDGEDIENILLFLRQNGCTMVDCIRIIMPLQGSTLEEANSLVHYSKAWKDMRDYTEKVHDFFMDGLEKLQRDDEEHSC